MDNLKEKVLEFLPWKLAYEQMGVYCQSVSGPSGYKKRTEKMEGWNEYGSEFLKKAIEIEDYIQSIPAGHKDTIIEWLLEGKIQIGKTKSGWKTFIDTSDLFAWGYSNSDEFDFTEIEHLKECFELSPSHGCALFECRRSKLRPQKPYYKYFSDEEKILFDNCGEKYGWS